jgi:ABC-type phosphate/phosphonate transport system substrate-binding protein
MEKELRVFQLGAMIMLLVTFPLALAQQPATQTGKFKMPDIVGIATYATGSATQILTATISPYIEKELGVPVRLAAMANDRDRVLMVKQGKMHAWNASGVGATMMNEATGYWADRDWGPQGSDLVWAIYDLCQGAIVKGNSKFQTAHDIKAAIKKGERVRVAYDQSSEGNQQVMDAYLAFGGVSRSEVQVVWFPNYTSQILSVGEGKA